MIQKNFSLDHFLPWSFVAHDELWNLIPTIPEVNFSKSNNFPAERYLDSFIRLQYLSLEISHSAYPNKDKWRKKVEPYFTGLSLQDDTSLLHLESLKEAYSRTIKPLVNLASNQGFKQGWEYKT